MAFQPLTPAEPEPEPYRFQAWHGLVLVGVMTIGVPGLVLLSGRESPPTQPAGGAYATVGDTSLGGGTDGGVELSGPSTLAIYTIPVGVEIVIDGQPAGMTPFRQVDLERRAYIVSLRADGYFPIDTVVNLRSNPQYLLAVDLVPDGSMPVATVTEPPTDMPTTTTMPPPTTPQGRAPAQPAAPGSLPGLPEPIDYSPAELRVTVVPWGSIYIDGQLVVRETDVRQTFTLPPGPHTIAAEHPTLGRTEATIDLIPGSTRSVTLEL